MTNQEAIEIIKNGRHDTAAIEQALEMAIVALEKQEHEKWHPITPDISESFPDNGRLVLVSFDNAPGIDVARFRRDVYGGAFCPGDEDVSYTKHGIFVNAWKECLAYEQETVRDSSIDETYDDLVCRQDVWNMLNELGGCGASDDWTKGWDEAINGAISHLKEIPAAK